MAEMHDDDRRSRRSRRGGREGDRDRERMRGTGGYDPYSDRGDDRGYSAEAARYGGEVGEFGPQPGYGRREEEYGGRTGRYGSGQDDEDRHRERREAMRTGSGWYGTDDYDRYAAGGRYGGRDVVGSESMGGTVSGLPTMAGMGPKGYRRSDERIREDVCDRLTDDPEIDARAIEVKVKGGEVTLSGAVENRRAKRHAEALIDRVSGVKDVHNGLRVQDGEGPGPGGGKRSGRSAAGARTTG